VVGTGSYHGPVRKPLAIVAVASIAAAVGLTGCSSLPLLGGSGGGSGLHQALARVAANDATRTWVSYDATGKLTKLVGKQLTGSGFGALLLGGTDLGQAAQNLADDTGIAALDAEYGISAGLPPRTVSVLVGGQHADRIGGTLTKSGWTKNGDRYVAPAMNTVTDDSRVMYALDLAQVRTDGGDVIFGKSTADLGTAGHPAGKTLADDQPTGALADCLGDVVVAQLVTDYQSPAKRLPPAAQAALAKQRPAGIQLDKLKQVAVGVRTPKSASDTPRAVVCTAWADQSAADGYAAAVPSVLAGGKSLATNEAYAQLLRNPDTTKVGGSAHIVQWSAQEADQAAQIITMLQQEDLPGLF
jgi:hypothetical protein